MRYFNEHLDQKSESALCEALGVNITLMSPAIDINANNSQITTGTVSLTLGIKAYLIIDNDWTDTPVEAIDYYFMNVYLSDKPVGIEVYEESSVEGWLHKKASSLSFSYDSFVKKIVVYEYSEKGESESVSFDAGILFEFDKGEKMLISRDESITGFLLVSFTEETINPILATLTSRNEFDRKSKILKSGAYNKTIGTKS